MKNKSEYNRILDTQPVRPEKEYLNNTKVTNYISSVSGVVDRKTLELKTIPKKNISVIVNLESDKNINLPEKDITQFDLAVMDSVYTMYANGCDVFTSEMLVRVMTGMPDLKVTQQKADNVAKSLNKLRRIDVNIECTDELIARKKIKSEEKVILKGYLLPLNCIQVKSANHKKIMNGYRLLSTPPLYQYAEYVNQIISVPIELFSSKAGSLTEEVILLKRELIKIIERMKNPINSYQTRSIRYVAYDAKTGVDKGLFARMGYVPENFKSKQAWLNKRSEIHKNILSVLDEFVSEKYIAGYSVNQKGNEKTGIIIRLYEDPDNTVEA